MSPEHSLSSESASKTAGAWRILIAAGASAGHLYPALSFAECIARQYPLCTIAFVSSRRNGIESNIAPYQCYLISIRPFSGPLKKLLQAVYGFIKSFIESFFIIEKFRPDVVIGFGSYVSFPILLEAALLKKHILLHEQNVSLGKANKWLSPFADAIAVSFKESEKISPRCVFTGNPLRASLTPKNRKEALGFFNLEDRFTIMALGGSQGSHRINNEFSQALSLLDSQREVQAIHIAGRRDYLGLQKSSRYTTIKHRLFDFLPQMQWAYSAADVVVCRAGAGTIAELAYYGKAAIVIPYPYAGGHQRENASVLAKHKAAVVIEEHELTAVRLSETIRRLMDSAKERQGLEKNIRTFCVSDGAARLVRLAASFLS